MNVGLPWVVAPADLPVSVAQGIEKPLLLVYNGCYQSIQGVHGAMATAKSIFKMALNIKLTNIIGLDPKVETYQAISLCCAPRP